ncbi:MAG TPA: ATP phosphoribosyltransferase [Spirochaetales bacterium]|nr:ATP phosphoribosyltransferase [Spirochaetales bacterium]HRY53947.1 ATP phosphoribosyltransferase [Spirochaetia bacterium]HRZ64122.1 ATP phosphoribosyltransferase [Spirochaetia bacterium]
MAYGEAILRMGLPKGRMQAEVLRLLADSGLPVKSDERGYRPRVGEGRSSAFEAKFLKPQNIVEMLDSGSRDIGFAGADWVAELRRAKLLRRAARGEGEAEFEVVELLDTGLDPVSIVAAAPQALLEAGELPRGRALVVASEYESLAGEWIERRAPGSAFIRSYGATEAFPPEDADVIVDNCATGGTLRANGLQVLDVLMESSTRLYASSRALEDPAKREAAEALVLVLGAVLEARRRVMVEINVAADRLAELSAALPCLRSPTISPLEGGNAFAVRIAAPRSGLAALIPEIRRRGGTDIVVTELAQLVP